MPYGSIKVDNIVFTNGGSDQTVTVSGLVASTSGNLTVTGTVSGNIIRGQTVSGVTVTGTTANFASGTFTTLFSGVTVTGTTANFTSGNFTVISGGTYTITSGVFASGTAANPSISFVGDSNTGVYASAADQVSIATSGTERLRVDASGRLGWGRSPGEVLHLGGSAAQNIRINGNTNAMYLGTVGDTTQVAVNRRPTDGTIPNTARGTAFININGLSTGGSIELATSTAANTGATTALTIDSSQRVGIGTTSPSTNGLVTIYETTNARLFLTDSTLGSGYGGQVRGSGATGAGGNLSLGVVDNNVYNEAIQVLNQSTSIIFKINSGSNGSTTERMLIDSSGRLLVGTSTALLGLGEAQTVQIQGNTSSGEGGLLIHRNTTGASASGYIAFTRSRGTTSGSVTAVQADDRLGGIFFGGANGTDLSNIAALIAAEVDGTPFSAGDTTDLPGRLVLSTTADGASSPTERMRITQSGDLVKKPGSATRPTPSAGDSGLYSDAGYGDTLQLGNTFGSGKGYANFFYNTTIIGNITANGTTGVSFNTSSDYRLKENILPLTGAIDRLQQIPVHRFNFIADPDRTVDGFIAHEAQAVVPECVTGTKDEVDADGNPVYQGIDQSKLVPLLTAALQEAIAKIETLEAKVAALEGV